ASCERARSRVLAEPAQGRAGQGADWIEGDVAPELDPDLGSDVGLDRSPEAGGDESTAQGFHASRTAAIGLAEHEAVTGDMPDHAGLGHLGCRINDTADHT